MCICMYINMYCVFECLLEINDNLNDLIFQLFNTLIMHKTSRNQYQAQEQALHIIYLNGPSSLHSCYVFVFLFVGSQRNVPNFKGCFIKRAPGPLCFVFFFFYFLRSLFLFIPLFYLQCLPLSVYRSSLNKGRAKKKHEKQMMLLRCQKCQSGCSARALARAVVQAPSQRHCPASNHS